MATDARVCDKCGENFRGFGTTCGKCRRLSRQGSVRACEVCGAYNQTFAAVCPDCLAGERDRHVSLRLRFKLPEGKEDQLEVIRQSLTAAFQPHKDRLYAGFAVHDDEELLLRAGFENADDMMKFFQCMKADFEKAVSICGFSHFGISITAPKEDGERLQEAMGALGAELFQLEETSRWYHRGEPGPDRHVSLSPFFTVPRERLDEFKALFSKFYEGSRLATKERLYYGWAMVDNVVFCRQGYKNAEGVLAHLRDADAVLQEALAIVGDEGMDLSCVGPVEELEKLRVVLGPYTPKFFELCEDSEWLAK